MISSKKFSIYKLYESMYKTFEHNFIKLVNNNYLFIISVLPQKQQLLQQQ